MPRFSSISKTVGSLRMLEFGIVIGDMANNTNRFLENPRANLIYIGAICLGVNFFSGRLVLRVGVGVEG